MKIAGGAKSSLRARESRLVSGAGDECAQVQWERANVSSWWASRRHRASTLTVFGAKSVEGGLKRAKNSLKCNAFFSLSLALVCELSSCRLRLTAA